MTSKGFLVMLLVCCVAALAEKYTDKYDNIDLNEVMKNRRLLLGYVNCVLDKGKCTPEGKELKDNLKEAIETGCEKCTEAQKDGTSTMIRHLIKEELAIWHELTAKFDPDGKWRKMYEDEARAHDIVIPE